MHPWDLACPKSDTFSTSLLTLVRFLLLSTGRFYLTGIKEVRSSLLFFFFFFWQPHCSWRVAISKAPDIWLCHGCCLNRPLQTVPQKTKFSNFLALECSDERCRRVVSTRWRSDLPMYNAERTWRDRYRSTFFRLTEYAKGAELLPGGTCRQVAAHALSQLRRGNAYVFSRDLRHERTMNELRIISISNARPSRWKIHWP